LGNALKASGNVISAMTHETVGGTRNFNQSLASQPIKTCA
jgi:hypothetical protein